MAAYCQVYGVIHFTSPAGWLPVYRDQFRAQRSVTSTGKLYLLPFLRPSATKRAKRWAFPASSFTCCRYQPCSELTLKQFYLIQNVARSPLAFVLARPCSVYTWFTRRVRGCVTLHVARSPLFRATNEVRDFRIYRSYLLSLWAEVRRYHCDRH